MLIALDPQYQTGVLDGRKTSTVRKGQREEFVVGPHFLLCGQTTIPIMIRKVRYCRFDELDIQVANSDGFRTLEELLAALRNFYTGIAPEDQVTIVDFEVRRPTTKIHIHLVMEGKAEDGREISPDQAHGVAAQLVRDAACGSYGEFPPYWNTRWDGPLDAYAKLEGEVVKEDGQFRFVLGLSSELFPIDRGGLQHLMGLLLGDLLKPRLPGYKVSFRISHVEYPEEFRTDAMRLFREHAYPIHSIREQFKLKPGEPLLAFSFKPRLGMKVESLHQVTMDVLKAGFHIVEIDTRDIRLDPRRVEQLVRISQDAANLGCAHTTRFSINLSVPSFQADECIEKFLKATPAPIVLKIDGGIDGISSSQGVRRRWWKREKLPSPIITCYPLLRYYLREPELAESFLDMLWLSGVDIAYIGGRPPIGAPGRQIGTSEQDEMYVSVERYARYVKRGWPMPTIAAGIYPGQLQAYYDLLGPDVAYFLGGAVALHKEGPVEGAKLCVKAIRSAVELRQKAGKGEVKAFPDKLVKELEENYSHLKEPKSSFNYVSPVALYQEYKKLKAWAAR